MMFERNSPMQRKGSQDGTFPRLRLEEQLSIAKKPVSLLSAGKDFTMERGEMHYIDDLDDLEHNFLIERKLQNSCPTCGSSMEH